MARIVMWHVWVTRARQRVWAVTLMMALVAALVAACGATPRTPRVRKQAAPPGNPVDIYVHAASTRACLEARVSGAANTQAFARYLAAHELASGRWQQLVRQYAEKPALSVRVAARVQSCGAAAEIQVTADGRSLRAAMKEMLIEELGARVVAAESAELDRLVRDRWREFSALADPPLLITDDGMNARVLVFRDELRVAALEATGAWTEAALPTVGVATEMPARWGRDARRAYVTAVAKLNEETVWLSLTRGSDESPDDLRDVAHRYLAHAGGPPVGTWRSGTLGGMRAETFDGYVEIQGAWKRVVLAAVLPEIGGVVFFRAVAPARYERAFAPTFARALGGIRPSKIVNRTGRHHRDHSPHTRQAVTGVGEHCPEPVATPSPDGWWETASRACPAGSTREESQDGWACWTADRRIVGVRASVYGDGSPSSYTSYCDGIEHGPAVYFGVSGRKSAEGNFRRGEKHGVWRTFYKTGERKDEVGYRAGAFHGEDKYWKQNGQLVRVKHWRDGVEDPR